MSVRFSKCCALRSRRPSSTPAVACTSAGPPACSVKPVGPSSSPASVCSSCSSSAPPCSSCSAMRSIRSAPSCAWAGGRRDGTARRRLHRLPYGLANRSLGSVALLGPLRMDYEKAIRAVRAASFRAVAPGRRGLRGRVEVRVATTERDYYDVLGVPRDASDADVKKAFRLLARELHPDVSDAVDAGHRFREVAEAYEVLSDPEQRADLRSLWPRRAAQGSLPADRVRPRQPLRHLRCVLRRRDLRWAVWRPSGAGSRFGGRGRSRSTNAFGGVTATVDVRVAVACERMRRKWEPSRARHRLLSNVRAAQGRVQQVSQSVFGQFVRALHVSALRRRRPAVVQASVRGLRRRRACARAIGRLEGRDPGRHPRWTAHPAARRRSRGRAGRAGKASIFVLAHACARLPASSVTVTIS